MANKEKTAKARAKPKTRTSVSFPEDDYRTLEEIAAHKKVSVAWVIRDATEKYVSDQWPLLERKR